MSRVRRPDAAKSNQWDLERLRVFVAVVQQGSLTRAAVALGRPQPAISRQISRLEDECNGRLFNRTGRGMTLTDLGESVFPRVVSLLEEAKRLSEQVQEDSNSVNGEVRLGALPSMYMLLGIPLFEELRKNFPSIRLQIYEGSAGQIDQWLSNGFVDIGLPYRYGESFPPQVDPLLKVSSYLVGAPDTELTENPTVRFSSLDQCPLVLPGTPSNVRVALDQIAKQAGIHLDVVLQADSSQIQKATAQLGGVYTVLPAHAVAEEVEAGSLRMSRIIEPEFHRTVVLVTTPATPPSRATRQVARTIREIIAKNRDYWDRIGGRVGRAR